QTCIAPENRPLELLQRGRRLDPELVDEQPPALAVPRERVRLPAGTVEREHQLPPWTLPQRFFRDERLELTYQPVVPSQFEVGVDALLERGEAKLCKSTGSRRRERL